MPEFTSKDHDCIIRTATKVEDHDRRLGDINGHLADLNAGQNAIRASMNAATGEVKSEIGDVRETVSGLKGRLLVVAASATAVTSGILSGVIVVVNGGM